MKRCMAILLSILTLLLLGCSPAPAEPTPVEAPPAAEASSAEAPAEVPEMTLEELAQYNGKDGAKAYIAVDGMIYDVSPIPAWAGGLHQNKVQAGTDASEMIGQSPHGKKVLEKLQIVGKLKQ